MIDKLQAASELFGDVISPDGELILLGTSSTSRVPTDEESIQIEAKAIENEAHRQSTQYRRDRAKEYPAIGDQLDALFKAGVFPSDMQAQLQAVKDKYPKGVI